MNKKISYILSAIFIMLVGCNVQNTEDATTIIKPTELTQLNENIIKSSGMEDTFLFDIEINDENQKYIRTWIDYYKNGEFQDNMGDSYTLIQENNLTISFSKTTMNLEELGIYESWNSAVISEKGYSSSQSGAQKVPEEPSSIASTQLTNETEIKSNQPYILALVVKDNGNSIALSIDRLNESEEEINAYVKDYEEVYLYRVMISEEEPKFRN